MERYRRFHIESEPGEEVRRARIPSNYQLGGPKVIELETARALAQKAVGDRRQIDAARCTETREGWYFPYAPAVEIMFGSNGVIVNKHTGLPLVLGSAFSVERDIKAFDEGFQFRRYHLVILEVRDRKKTVEILLEVDPTITVPEYEDGTVWKIPRSLSEREIDERLDRLPAIFADISLYFRIESLQTARTHEYFRFEALAARAPSAG